MVSISNILNDLQLPQTLQERINITINGTIDSAVHNSFILYLPTVVLRQKHNPALAVACRLANKHNVPLLILCVVLDDTHYPLTLGCHVEDNSAKETTVVVGTTRRLTFILQALQAAAQEWMDHTGAIVKIRIHGPGSRIPHHLSLARQAMVVVTDEPFVHPFLKFVRSTEAACQQSNTPCVRVDGSTTVPPACKLRKTATGWSGVPPKAWMWEKETNSKRRGHVYGAVRAGHFDAPRLVVTGEQAENKLRQFYPKDWIENNTDAPGRRPWTVSELTSIDPIEWSKSWPGIDNTVPQCIQTHGALGWERWKSFQSTGLASYARRRNDITQPHAVSRLSCYLNLGTISIFQIIYDFWEDTKTKTSKFEDEIIKWREIGYAHTFANEQYFNETVIPKWASKWWNQCLESHEHSVDGVSFSLQNLADAQSSEKKWDAMQNYLNTTGELHNNARMSWGKTMLHWLLQSSYSIDDAMKAMAFVNDRYALDGISPPSYAGLLWCWGWCDKPGTGGGISTKWTSKYRAGPEGFVMAQNALLNPNQTSNGQLSISSFASSQSKSLQLSRSDTKRKTSPLDESITSFKKTPDKKKDLTSFFPEVKKRQDDTPYTIVG